jgi:hypothetical protein
MKRSYAFSVRAGRLARAARGATAFALVAGLAACSSSPPLFLSDGRPTTLVQCPEGSDSCAQQARVACGGQQFDVVRQSSDNGTLSLIYACPAK